MTKIFHKIRKKAANAITEFDLLQEGDRILVGVSGGVDSTTLLLVLNEIKLRSPVNFEIEPVLVDQKFPQFDAKPFEQWLKKLGFNLKVLEFDTFSLISQPEYEGESPCQICSRMRRGILYTYAIENRLNKIALGHNRDDLNETLLLNLFYAGTLASMPAKLKANDGLNTVIRPLCYVSKQLISEYHSEMSFPVLVNEFCEQKPQNSRLRIRKLLLELEKENEKIPGSILTAQKNIKLSQLLDKKYWKRD